MIMRERFLILFLVLVSTISFTFAETTQTTKPVTVSQSVSFETCSKIFSTNKENLFYLTLNGISANKFSINEIQTENGYIIFTAANNKYLATIGMVDSNNSILKITPCNNVYFFQPGIILNMFKYIELNIG
jgi:hypothetical protein